MDDLHFDTLARGLASRRRLLTGLAALPVFGGLLGLLHVADDAEAGGRKRRKRRKHKRKKNRCKPDCAGKCGGATDGCGSPCSGACPADQVCDGTSCQACDVCASGCAHTTIQAAITAASAGAVIRVCAGTYALAADETIDINTALTIIGAGAGKSGTIIDGQDLERATAVVAVSAGNVELRNLAVTGGNRTGGANPDWGGGIQNLGGLTLSRVRVTDNQSESGGGLWNAEDGRLTLSAGTAVTRNSATVSGGGITNFGALELNDGSSVTDNEAPIGSTGGGIRMKAGNLTIAPGATLANNEPDDCFGTGCPT